MPRGGRRPGAGRPIGTGVLEAEEIVAVAAECQRRWNRDCEERLLAAQNAYFGQSDYDSAAARVRHSRGRDSEALEDVEYSRREMARMDPDDEADAPRVVSFDVRRPYKVKDKIVADVADWASTHFGKSVSQGVVRSAWDVLKKVEADDV